MTNLYQDVSVTRALSEMLVNAAHADRDQRNRRTDARYPFSSPVTLGTIGADGKFRAVMEVCSIDVSSGGMGLLSKTALPTGKTIWLEMQSRTPKAWRIRARIIYCRPLFSDVFRVGAEFISD